MALTLGELAEKIGGKVAGDAGCVITGVATLQNARPGDITFLANPRYRRYLARTAASATILTPADQELCPGNVVLMDEPYVGYARAAAILHPRPQFVAGIHPAAIIAADCVVPKSAFIGANVVIETGVTIGRGASIGPGCIIGSNVSIGDDCRLAANITVCRGVTIGRRVMIHPGSVIGADGFGLANDNGVWVKVPQLGGVDIGDDVEIGANTTIDRGALENTIIEDGVKLDNQIQIAHNVRIGAHTAIAACVGIAGSTRIGRHCTIGGGVGIIGHLDIVDDAHITAMSFVTKSITRPGVYSSGMPVEPSNIWRRNTARLRHIDDMARRLHDVERMTKK